MGKLALMFIFAVPNPNAVFDVDGVIHLPPSDIPNQAIPLIAAEMVWMDPLPGVGVAFPTLRIERNVQLPVI